MQKKHLTNSMSIQDKHLREMRCGRTCLFSLFLFNTVLEFLASAKSQEEEIKRHTVWKGSNKTVSIAYTKNPKEFISNKLKTNKKPPRTK